MNKNVLIFLFLIGSLISNAQNTAARKAKSDLDQETKASQWVSSLNLKDSSKIERVEKLVSNHLKTIRDYHNSHPYTEIPEGINPKTGDKLTELDRRIIAHSGKSPKIRENFMSDLRRDLSEEEINQILDKHSVGKVNFTMKAYHEIVLDLSGKEETYIRELLERAREQSIDFKNMEEISAIFEIYKTKAENYLNANGRNWRQLYKDYANRNK